jgi:hypothetical protein
MPPPDASTEVGRKPTMAVRTGAVAANEVGRWDRGSTPSGTWEEHCSTELLRPSSSLRPCVHEFYHPR